MSNVLITGCSSGFGLLTARTFARRGHQVIATVRDFGTAAGLKDARDAENLPILIRQLDVRDSASVQAGVAAALDNGPIDVLINNAGYALRCAIEEVEDDAMLSQFDTNVFGVVRLIRAVAPTMRERRSGVIVNVSSIVAWSAMPFSGLYSGSKAALNALSETLHYELAPFGVRVVLVEPSAYPTRFLENSVFGRTDTPESAYATVLQSYRVAAGRLITQSVADPQEVAEAIYGAVYAETHEFRHVVGAIGKRLAAVRQSTDFEGFERFMRTTLNWHVGARDASQSPATPANHPL